MMTKTLENFGVGQQKNASPALRTGIAAANSVLGNGQAPGGINPQSLPFIAQSIGLFKEKFVKLLKDAETSGKVITKEVVTDFFKDLESQRKKPQ